MNDERNDRISCFEDELRRWGAQAPRTPASVARVRVLVRLDQSRRPWPWLRLAAAAALLVLVAVGVWRGRPRPAGETATHVALNAPPLDPDVVVWKLDARTTVYFMLGPQGPGTGGTS
jgi:hypothetical protein